MQSGQPVRVPALNCEHIIQGIWKTRGFSIDGQEISMDMVKGRLHRDGWYPYGGFGDVQEFTWGVTATPRELQLLAYSCCEFARLDQWSQHITSRFALEQLFTSHLQQLPSDDFTLRYADRELRAAMRRFKRGGKAPYWWSRMRIFLVHGGGEPASYPPNASYHCHAVHEDGAR